MSKNGRRTAQKRKYNKAAYVSYLLRVRAESELADRLGEHVASGGTSLNFLITAALCSYLDVELPHKHYDVTQRTQIYPPPFPWKGAMQMTPVPIRNCHHCAYEFEPGDNYYDFPGFPILCEDCITEFAKTVPAS